ncbi:MAG: response regulator, partial [Opitutales bacterium]
EFLSPNRQSLPELTLISGLGVSALLGLVVNLAQAAYSRQRAAESTSAQLRAENEERRRIEARLKVADERLNLALDSTQVGVYEWDVPSGATIYSASFWTSLGYDPGAMASTWQTWLDLMHPDDAPAFQAAITAHFQGQTPYLEQEFRLRHHHGEWHWLSARAKCVAWDTRGQPRRVTGTCQDITERRRAEETLRASLATTRKLSLVASRTDNAVAITRADGTVEWVNESFTRLAEQSLADVTNRPFVELISSPDTNPHAVARIAAAIARVEAITTDVLHHTPSGRHYYVHLEVQPLVNAEGRVENFIIIETNITSRVEVEQQLRRAKSEADAASRAKSEFLASMSHEIRTPMNGVIGMTSLLLDTPLSAEQRDYVSTIRTSGDALLSIINEILDFSKIESGKMELENRAFELAQCVEEALDIFALQAAAKQIELASSIDPALPRWIMGDITRLRQVLVNLLNNAVKFTPRGFITVEVRPAANPPVNGPHLFVDFFVTDTGIGIPPNRLNALFKPFSQVDSSTTRKYGGTGLGLAICDRLCHLMGGAIEVSSKPGEGSRFRFNIQTETAPGPAGGTPVLALGGAVVLAVDDHPVNRTALADCLAGAGLTARLAADMDEAMEQARDGSVQLLIVDYDLAGRPGRDLIPRLRARQPHLPVIMFTGAADGARDAEDEPNVIRLPKPIKPSILLEFVTRALKSGSGPVAAGADPVAQAAEATLGERIPLDILLVEDNPVNQKVALRFLQRLGYAADSVPNGLEAVRTCTQHQYDLVFMDIQMPEMDGLTACREIRSRVAAELQPKIVALTANAVTGDRERCLAAGMDDYLSKPVKMESLEKTILKYFSPAETV